MVENEPSRKHAHNAPAHTIASGPRAHKLGRNPNRTFVPVREMNMKAYNQNPDTYGYDPAQLP